MKKIVAILIVAVVLIGGGIYFILPTNIDWDECVQNVSETVQKRTGLVLTVEGTPEFSMKPSPILKVGRINLKNIQDSTYDQLMTAVRGEILFDTGSLFRRKIKIKKITLFSPQFYFEMMPDGKWNWQIAILDRMRANPIIGFDNLTITDGKAEIKVDQFSNVRIWDKINASISTGSVQGSYSAEGNLDLFSSVFGFSLKVENFRSGQSPTLSLRLANALSESSFVFNGTYGLSDADRGIVTGGMTYDIRKPEPLFSMLYPDQKLPSVLFQPIVGNLNVSRNSQTKTLELSNILFKYGSSAATGKLAIQSLPAQENFVLPPEGQFDSQNDGLTNTNNSSEPKVGESQPVRLPKTINGSFIFSRLDADPFFDNVGKILDVFSQTNSGVSDTYNIDLLFDVVNYKKDVIHQLKTKVVSSAEGISFTDFSATLPSNAYVSGQGGLTLTKSPILSGNLSIEADSIRVVLNWLGIPIAEDIPQNLLRQLKMTTNFKVARSGFILQQLQGTLDQSDFSGDVAWRFGTHPAIRFSADISDLNVRSYFPEKSKQYAKTREEISKLSLTEKIKKLFDYLTILNDFDLSAQLKTNTFSWADINAENFKADFSVVKGHLKINEISGKKIAASTISLRGEAYGFGGDPRFDDFQVKVDAQQLSSLRQMWGFSSFQGVSSQDKMLFSATLTGSLQAMQIDTKVDFGALRFSAQGDIREVSPNIFDWNVQTSIYHENFRNFIRLFSDNYRPVLANPGTLNLKGRMLKSQDLFSLTDMTVQIGNNELDGSIKVTKDEKQHSVLDVQLHAKELAPLGLLPRMYFVDKLSVDTQNQENDTLLKDGVLSRFADKLSFSQKPFDFSFLKDYETNISLTADRLFFNSFMLSEVDSVVKLSAGKMVIDIRRSLWNQANFGGIFNLTLNGGILDFQGALRISALNVPAKLFNSKTVDISNVQSFVLNANMKANGTTTDELFSSLSAKGNVSFKEASVDQLNIRQFEQDLKNVPDVSKEMILDRLFQGKTQIQDFFADMTLQDHNFMLRPSKFMYDGKENKTAFFTYNYITKALSIGLSFPSGIVSVPDLVLSIQKEAAQPSVLTENVSSVFDAAEVEKRKMKEQEQKRIEEEQKKEREKVEKLKKDRSERLNNIEERVGRALTDLSEKLATVQSMAEKVYQVKKYEISLNKFLGTLKDLDANVKKLKAVDISEILETQIDDLENQVQTEYFDQEGEINSDYDTALIVGMRGAIFNDWNEGNEILRLQAKDHATHSDLKELAEHLDQMVKEIDTAKRLQLEAEAPDTNLEKLTIYQAQADAVLVKIKEIRKKTLEAIALKEQKIKQQREEEEKKKLAQAEKQKAKTILSINSSEQENKREAQGSIVRVSDQEDSTYSSVPSTSSEGQSSSILQPLSSDVSKEDTTINEKSEKANPVVIRKR